jgi:acyl-CoA synthetase (AMP-forming)/AMP-acid ligase II/acyl carrier protein
MTFSFLKDFKDADVQNCSTYTEVIKNRTKTNPNHVVFRFLEDGVNESESFTYGQLDRKSKSVAASLQESGQKGDTVLLLFQPNLSYVASLYACFYSGFIAVPAYPPRRNRGIERIYTIIADSKAKICLISRQVYTDIQRNFKDNELFENLKWIIYEDVCEGFTSKFFDVDIFSDDIALLQYTSGSTGQPKGVMISQLNLLYNSEYIRQSFNVSKESVGVHWLPLFHDMGLIGGILQAAYAGGVNINMPPMAFLKNPLNWLKAIEKYGGTIAGGPNFTYDYCIQKTSVEEREKLDLSKIDVFFCGAEPIRKSTYDQFLKEFSPSGVRPEQLLSCYGMAETTLIVTGAHSYEKPKYLAVDSTNLSVNTIKLSDENDPNAMIIVGCGHTLMETVVEIVNPKSNKLCASNEVGEIWVSGPTIALGYWDKSEETERNYSAKIVGSNSGQFLRTGDLGFMRDGELYVTGRLKDMIIIRGVNYYPADIEQSIQKTIPEIRTNGGAAFPVNKNNQERLVIVQELERTAMRGVDQTSIIDGIREIIATEFEIDIYSIVLIRAGSLPMTSSGKIQHRQTKYEYLNSDLSIVSEWVNEDTDISNFSITETIAPTEESLREWLIQWIMRNQSLEREEIDLDKNIMTFGIDSLAAVTLETEISKQFGFQWHLSSFILNPTINMLVDEGIKLYQEKE